MAVLSLSAAGASAQSAEVLTLNIEPQQAGPALMELASSSGVQIMLPDQAGDEVGVKGLKGSYKLEEALALGGKLGRHLHENVPDGVRLMGPAAAPVVRLKTDYRYQFILKGRNRKLVAEVVARARRFAVDEN